MNWAIYRIHYGTDFILESIKSIINDVDKIFIFYSEKPWVVENNIIYKGLSINFPNNPENVKQFINNNLSNKKIILQKFECNTPKNQFGKLYEIASDIEKIRPNYVLFMEPDMIFGKGQFKILKFELNLKFWSKNIISKQIEIWKFDKTANTNQAFRIPLRKKRVGPVLWKVKKGKQITTNLGGEPLNKSKKMSKLVTTLNLGFSFNKNTMFYKHLMALTFSKIIGDSSPDEKWYEDKWLKWNEKTENLEISEGYQHRIKKAYKYKIPYKFYQYFLNKNETQI